MKYQNGQCSGRVPMHFQMAPRHMADERLLSTFPEDFFMNKNRIGRCGIYES
ncbi:MAG: hypothetical protein RLO12_13910 [Fulvivirga sp.]